MSALRPERGAAAPSFILADELGEPGTEFDLSEPESHYVARVCRARAGDHVSATDGRGAIAELELLQVTGSVRARVRSAQRLERTRDAELWCGAPEGERADWLIEKLAELGISRVRLLDTERARWQAGDSRMSRWRRLAVAALRQSRQCWRMELLAPEDISSALEDLTPPISGGATSPTAGGLAPPASRSGLSADESPRHRAHHDAGRWLADPDGVRASPAPSRGSSIGAIGPAAGFSIAERSSLIERGFQPISLAAWRLRTETAALSWAAWWASGAPAA